MTSTVNIGATPEVPGTRSWKRSLQEVTSAGLQNFAPVKQLDLHLCGFAFYKDDPNRQVQLHHYCHSLSDDLIQCAVYDGDKADSKLIGIEYVISRKLFDTLPPEEQKYWHSHAYDVKSGSFVAPRLPDALEQPLMKEIADTYGKTWVLWQTDRGDQLPLGEPKLMMVATRDGQWNESLFQRRDANKTLENPSEYIKKLRGQMQYPPVNPNADWGAHQAKNA